MAVAPRREAEEPWGFWWMHIQDTVLASQKREDSLKYVSRSLTSTDSPQSTSSLARFFSLSGRSPNGWLERFFSASFFKAPAANTCLNCHWLTPKDGHEIPQY